MTSIEFRLLHTVSDCEKMWKALSPCRSLYDEWDFRFCFYKDYSRFQPYFYVAFEGERPVGLLPLQFNADSGKLEFFGGDFMEDNHVFTAPGYSGLIPSFFEKINQAARLRCIKPDSPFIQGFPKDYPNYSCSLEGLADGDAFINRFFSSKSRANLKKKIRSILELPLQVTTNHFEDLEIMFRYNMDTFGGESFFADPVQKKVFSDLCHLRFPVFVHTFLVNGEKEAVSISIIHKKVYFYLMSGTNKKEVPNLGTYLVMKNIETALSSGCTVFDAGRHDCNWKERWHLSKTEQYLFERTVP